MLRGLVRRGLAEDRRGTALVEFAAVAPVLIVLWLGSLQIEDGIACNRKVTIATRAIADLIAQNVSGTTNKSEVDSNLNATTMVLAPYDSSRATIRVTEVYTNLLGQTSVVWSRSLNGTPLVRNASVTIPLNLRYADSYLLYAEVTYNYKPPMNFGFIGPMKLGDNLFMLPRNSSKIDCSDC